MPASPNNGSPGWSPRLGLAECALQQIVHTQIPGRSAQIIQVKRASLNLEQAQDIAPLALGDLATLAVPRQLGQQGVLGGGHHSIDLGIVREGFFPGSRELLVRKGPFCWDT